MEDRLINLKKFFDSNRTAWIEALDYRQKAQDKALQIFFQDPDFTTFDKDRDSVLLKKLAAIDLIDKVIGQLP